MALQRQDVLEEAPEKESLIDSGRVKLTLAGVALNLLIAVIAKYLELDINELIALIGSNSLLIGNMIVQRTKRNTVV